MVKSFLLNEKRYIPEFCTKYRIKEHIDIGRQFKNGCKLRKRMSLNRQNRKMTDDKFISVNRT